MEKVDDPLHSIWRAELGESLEIGEVRSQDVFLGESLVYARCNVEDQQEIVIRR
jgi:hypothetical protein